MKVLKFGGTSVGTAERIKNVARLIVGRGRNIVVLSAMSGTTNSLVEIADYLYRGNISGAKETIFALESKYTDTVYSLFGKNTFADTALVELRGIFNYLRSFTPESFGPVQEKEILSQGELMSTLLMSLYLRQQGHICDVIPALDYVRIDNNGEPQMAYIAQRLKSLMQRHPEAEVLITQGYICRNENGEVDNLRRGGSDYTASIIGAVIQADEVQIWTDIDGMHNNDPRYVEGTSPVHELHFEEAVELAYFGAKILHPTCVLPAKLHNIPVRLLNTLQPDAEGTLIHTTPATGTIKAVAAKDNITAIKIKSGRMLLAHGFLNKVFETFDKYRTAVDMVATSEVGVSLTIDNEQYLRPIIDELKEFGTVTVDRDMVIICVVGDLEWHNCGFESKVLSALSDIPIRMISYGGSNYNISVLVGKDDKIKALNKLSAVLFNG